MLVIEQLFQAFASEIDQYARYKGEKTPSLFDDHGNASWDESKHPRVEKGSTTLHGGQFTSFQTESKPARATPNPASTETLFIPLRERKSSAEKLAKSGMTLDQIAEHLTSRGVAKVDAKKFAADAINANMEMNKADEIDAEIKKREDELRPKLKDLTEQELRTLNKDGWVDSKAHGKLGDPTALALDELSERLDRNYDGKLDDLKKRRDPDGIELPSKTIPNEQAKPGDQLGLFGEAVKSPKPFKPQILENATKAKQGGLFDTKGDPDQMDLFGDGGVMPKELVYQPIAISSQADLKKAFADVIADFGEKIGGARKDTAVPIGSRPKKEKPVDDSPTWRRKYHVAEDANRPGEFFVVNNVTQQPFGPGDIGRSSSSFSSMLAKRLGKHGKKPSDFKNFSSKPEAENAVAQIEVGRNHGVTLVRGKDGKPDTYGIYRQVAEGKRPLVKNGFLNHNDAERFMFEENPVSVIEHKFPDWEDYSYLDHVTRKGKEHRPADKDVKPRDFQEAFNFRGGEFGKWQMNQDGQTSLNHAYDGLHDLAETIGLPPRAMSLNGKLAIAFGSRGTGGKHSAKAHYEPDKEVINLTKMKGAGSLAHEWFHALDHYMAQQVHGPERSGKKTESLLSERLPYGKEHKGRQEVVDAWRELVNTMNSKTVDEKIQGDDKKLGHAKKTVSEVVDQLDGMLESNKRHNKRHKGLNQEQQKEWDAAKEKIKNLDVGTKTSIAALTEPDSKSWSSPSTFSPVQKLNDLYKKATGRSFHTADDNSHGHKIYWSIWRAQQEAEKISKASDGESMTKKKSTQFLDDSHALDKFRTGQYYAKDIEMAARAFQGYVYDKTEGVGKPSQYLNGKAHNKHYAGLITEDGDPFRPFPGGSERESINAAFDKLFKTIKTQDREDGKGKHIELYSSSASSSYTDRYLNDDLYYNEQRLQQTSELYSALYDVFAIDRYDQSWNEQLHPRGHKGSENGGRFTSKGDGVGTATHSNSPGSPSNRVFPKQKNRMSSKVREIVAAPNSQPHHSLHLKNQPPATQIAMNDYRKSFNHLWRVASAKAGTEWTDASDEEKIWEHLDKNQLTELLNNINAKDRALRTNGGNGLSDAMNYNQVIPRQFAERLHGGSRFFDPEKLRGRWNEAAPEPTNTPAAEPSELAKSFSDELNKVSKEKRNSSQPELPIQENPGQIQPPKVNPVDDELSPQTRNMVNKAISELISPDPHIIEAFRPILISAWKQKRDTVNDHNQAFRQIVGTNTPQVMSALVRSARNKSLDPATKRNFDIMVHGAESGLFGHLLQGRGEDGLLDLLSEGIKQEPNIMDSEVAELAVSMAGPSFFADHDHSETSDGDSWNDQFSWSSARALIEQYSNSYPTTAQLQAGNYRKKHVRIQGMGISIENEKGTRRKPEWPKLHCDYGYIKRTMGADGDHVDVFVGPSPGSEIVYVIDQVNQDGKFDEHKVMIGFTSKQQAIEAYRKCYTPSWKVGRVTAMTVGQFKSWLTKGSQRVAIAHQVSRYQMNLG